MNRRHAELRASESWRYFLIVAAVLLLLFVLVGRILMLQVMPGLDRGHEFLKRQGEVRTLRTETIPANRGIIRDRNGEPLAISSPVVTIWANPQQLMLVDDVRPLAKALGIKHKVLKEKIKRYRNKDFMYLKRQLSPEDAKSVIALKVSGVYGQREYRRFYPAGEVAAHLLGFTNIDDQGQEGIELAYDEWLSGKPGKKQVIKDLHGRIIKDIAEIKAVSPGNDLTLSIDLRLQYMAYRELKKIVKIHRAKGASLIMLDVDTGEILADVNQPSFNPNNRRRLSIEALRNRVFTDVFEPGSTVKPITMVAALESGKYTPSTVVDTNPGWIKVGRKTLLDPVNYGEISATKIITKSSQVGTSKVALSLGDNQLRDVFYRLGLGQHTASGFPGESAGYLPNHVQWKPIEKVTFAFGHGLSVTSAQLAQAYSIFASGGIKREISLLKKTADQLRDDQGQRVIPESVASSISKMLETVTLKGGTATRAQIPYYKVAGKTGTAHKVGRSGYDASRYTALFAGFAPVDNPKVVAVIVVDEPGGDEYYGGEVAAPVFSNVVGEALRVLNISPDDLQQGRMLTAGSDQ